jgi:hypothetical protein
VCNSRIPLKTPAATSGGNIGIRKTGAIERLRDPTIQYVSALTPTEFFNGIPRSRKNPKIPRIYDAEVVGDLIAVDIPVAGDVMSQEGQDRHALLRHTRRTEAMPAYAAAPTPILPANRLRPAGRMTITAGVRCPTLQSAIRAVERELRN